ncbi:Alpha/beta hydrolase fold-1 [Artemisia annua]|uniref:Alpha/beta hydrolase fold-1 n=1 Tax=Artemisia annua TaxID=35608 RepID=A0A2U1LTH2_ARTAN|nr:Alpha/beta hydrolase fold-1 [Artemisia annua]
MVAHIRKSLSSSLIEINDEPPVENFDGLGVAGTHDSWNPQAEGLLVGTTKPNHNDQNDRSSDDSVNLNGIQVCVFDNRGMGRSSVPKTKSDYTDNKDHGRRCNIANGPFGMEQSTCVWPFNGLPKQSDVKGTLKNEAMFMVMILLLPLTKNDDGFIAKIGGLGWEKRVNQTTWFVIGVVQLYFSLKALINGVQNPLKRKKSSYASSSSKEDTSISNSGA